MSTCYECGKNECSCAERAIAARALREAADELQAMATDPTDLLTESVGIRGPIAVALWLCDRADRLESEATDAHP